MGLLRRQPTFDRSRILDAANRARARRKRRKAIELYRWVLAVEPRNLELHAKLAPLLAETGQYFDAWVSFRTTAQGCLKGGQPEKALAVYKEAARFLPREIQVWQALARLQRKAGRDAEAIESLVEGSRHFRPRCLRAQAVYLLRLAREIQAWHFETVLELARNLASLEQSAEAKLLLEGLAERVEGHRLRRVRGVQLVVEPGPAAAFRWLRSVLDSWRSDDDPEERSASSGVVPLRPRRQAQR